MHQTNGGFVYVRLNADYSKYIVQAPRMVYFSMIYLLWSIFVEASTTFRPVVYGP